MNKQCKVRCWLRRWAPRGAVIGGAMAIQVAAAHGAWGAPAAERGTTSHNAKARPSTAARADESAEIAESVRQLDDDRYAVRQAAQRRLAAIGLPALGPVGAAAAKGSLESSTRAVSVLLNWAESKDQTLSLGALEALARLANRPIEAAIAQDRLAALRETTAIEALKGMGARITLDRSFSAFGGPNAPLQVILGAEWKGGIDGLRHVADVRSATTLSLWSAPLGDASLPQLATLTNVRRMELYGLSASPEEIEKIRGQLPNTLLDVRPGGARLGVRGLDTQEVVPNSPAAKAGLIVNDRIVEVAGRPVENFEQLTAEIAKCKPGDTVPVKIMRGGQTIDKEVTFDRWGDDLESIDPPIDPPGGAQGLFGPVPLQAPQRRVIPNR